MMLWPWSVILFDINYVHTSRWTNPININHLHPITLFLRFKIINDASTCKSDNSAETIKCKVSLIPKKAYLKCSGRVFSSCKGASFIDIVGGGLTHKIMTPLEANECQLVLDSNMIKSLNPLYLLSHYYLFNTLSKGYSWTTTCDDTIISTTILVYNSLLIEDNFKAW